MNYYRFNQIAMAVLGALLLFFGARTLINIAFEEHEEKPGYEVPGTETGKPGGEKPAGDELPALLAKADAKHGEEVAKKCGLCHNFEKGGPNMIGPNLYGVLGRKIASHEGYEYSDALKAKNNETWDYEKIDKMIANPGEYVPGTKMSIFPGLPDAKDRADVLAFLRTKNDNPPPLPEAKPGAETPAPAGGGEATPPAGGGDFMALLASADPKAGEADIGLCKVCHTFNKGGATLVGPNLYGVVGRKIASVEGFNYTPALKAHEGDWTFDKLDAWLTNPAAFAPGTMMAFPGIPDAKKRADVIAYLNANSDSPLPLPKPGAGGAPEEKKSEAPAPAPAAPAAAPGAPSAETPPPSAETPPAPAETPAAAPSEAAPPAGTAPAAAPEAAPSAETPPASAETPPASTETPAPASEAAPSAETPPAADAAPSGEDSILSNQPQPVYPEGSPQ